MRGLAPPEELDRYLRATWLGCCRHLGPLSVGRWGATRSRNPGARIRCSATTRSQRTSTTLALRRAFRPDDGRAWGTAHAEHSIELMARNTSQRPSARHGTERRRGCASMCDEDASGTLCDEPVEEPPHDAYGEPMPVLNPPCTGMCGYTGPAKPPH